MTADSGWYAIGIIERAIDSFHEEFYPTYDRSASLRKLLEEVGELAEAMLTEDSDEIAKEAADVAVLAWVICMYSGHASPPTKMLEKIRSTTLKYRKQMAAQLETP